MWGPNWYDIIVSNIIFDAKLNYIKLNKLKCIVSEFRKFNTPLLATSSNRRLPLTVELLESSLLDLYNYINVTMIEVSHSLKDKD